MTLKWDPNTEPDLAGYKVYYKTDSSSGLFSGTGAAQGSSPIDVGNHNTAIISGLDSNHSYYFAVTAYNTAGIESAFSNIVSVLELTPPLVSSFAMPAAVKSHTIPVTALVATDNDAVAGWMLTENSTPPEADDDGWSVVKPVSYKVSSNGLKTVYAFVKDAAGNVSAPRSANVSVSMPSLSVTMAGIGSVVGGTVTSNPVGISCMTGTCSAFFDDLSIVKLLLRPNINSTVVSWSSGCAGIAAGVSESDCTVNMNGSKAVTATLKEADRVRVGSAPFTTLSAAMSKSTAGAVIYARALEFKEQLAVTRPVVLKGGFYSDYTSNGNGYSYLKGVLQITTGSLVAERLVID